MISLMLAALGSFHLYINKTLYWVVSTKKPTSPAALSSSSTSGQDALKQYKVNESKIFFVFGARAGTEEDFFNK